MDRYAERNINDVSNTNEYDETNLIEISPKYVYMIIPAEYVCTYHKILIMMSDYGIDMLKDCNVDCKSQNRDIIKCFNMFNSAVAAKQLGQDKLAETLIKYIDTKIDNIYDGIDIDTTFELPITEDGNIKALITCGDNIKFEIDENTGELYERYLDEKDDKYSIENNNLIVK